MSNYAVCERWGKAITAWDLDALEEVIHPDITVRYPQSGEVMKGRENFMATLRNYPGIPEYVVEPLPEQRDEVIVTHAPGFLAPTITVTGAGDIFITEGKVRYPNGEVVHTIGYMRVADQKVIETTVYFAAPFDAPDWRKPYLES